MTHICISDITIIGSDNGLSPGRRQAIIRTNAGILLIRALGIKVSEILSEHHVFSYKKIHLKMSSEKWRPFCLCLSVLTHCGLLTLASMDLCIIDLNQVMTWCLICSKPLLEHVMICLQWNWGIYMNYSFFGNTAHVNEIARIIWLDVVRDLSRHWFR